MGLPARPPEKRERPSKNGLSSSLLFLFFLLSSLLSSLPLTATSRGNRQSRRPNPPRSTAPPYPRPRTCHPIPAKSAGDPYTPGISRHGSRPSKYSTHTSESRDARPP